MLQPRLRLGSYFAKPKRSISANVLKGSSCDNAPLKLIKFVRWQNVYPLTPDISGVVAGQSATARRGARLLHSLFAGATNPYTARNRRLRFPG